MLLMQSTLPMFHSTKKKKPMGFLKLYKREFMVSHVIVPVTLTVQGLKKDFTDLDILTHYIEKQS
jgi:hypothetical protein